MGKISKKKESKKSILAFPIDNNKITDLNNDLNNQKDMTSEDILPVIKQLSSLDANERAWAASCASHLVLSDPGTRRLLLSKNLIRSLIERLTDNVYEVIFEVIGTLRNLTVVGEYDICAEMFNKNILTPLITLIPKISVVINNILKGIPQESDPFVAARSTIWKFAENIICIFWSLSETSQKILRSINNANIISFLLAFFTPSELIPTQTIIAAAQCLNTLTDENPDIYFHFKNNPEYLKLLYYHINSEIGDNKTSDDHLNVKVLSCGILSNIRSILSPSLLPSLFSDINFYIIPVLIPCLSFDIQKCAEDAIETANNIETSDTLIKGQEMRGSILEALVGCLWTLARGLDGYVPFSEAQIETFIVSYHHSISDSMRVKIIGTLGVVARRQNAVKENKIIGDFMINVLQNLPPNGSTILDCAIEALNAIYDIYADKNFDYDQYVFVQGNYLNLLQNIMDPFRVMVKSIDKRNFRDQRLRADEALINLVAFIKYKKEERN
ncbi:3685_t:CDS:10 [Entrophospora sp. SA101]|nr:3685_t:CDS:10 [Entrophospora sp. SA101]